MWPLFLLSLGIHVGDGHEAVPADEPALETLVGSASGGSWHDLDLALAPLQGAPSEGPFSWGALLRVFLTYSEMEASTATSDISGVVFEDVDLYFAWAEGDVSWRVSADFDEGAARLEDAHARWRFSDGFVLAAGQFKPRVARSGSIPPDALLFRERTFLGAVFDVWDDGVEVGGHYDQFDYWISLTDGANGSESDHFWSLRGEWALLDEAFADTEGARDAPNHLRVLMGAYTFADAGLSNSDAMGFGGDFALTYGPYSFYAEWAQFDEQFVRTIDVFNGAPLSIGDGHPFSSTLSRRIGEAGEAAVRFQAADDPDSTQALGLSAGWRPGGGSARFLADLSFVDADSVDFSVFSLGIQVGSSGLSRPDPGSGPR